MRVVQGAKKKPKKAHQKLENAFSHRAGSISHHTKMARRGPTNTKLVKKQHICPEPPSV
jgi:hypothetical protein